MDTGEGPSQALTNTREDTIQVGNTLLLKLPSGDIKTWKLEKDSCDKSLQPWLTRAHQVHFQDRQPRKVWIFPLE